MWNQYLKKSWSVYLFFKYWKLFKATNEHEYIRISHIIQNVFFPENNDEDNKIVRKYFFI